MPYSNTPETEIGSARERAFDHIEIISLYMHECMEANANLRFPLTNFSSAAIPAISIKDYLQRCATYLRFDEVNFIHMLIKLFII